MARETVVITMRIMVVRTTTTGPGLVFPPRIKAAGMR